MRIYSVVGCGSESIKAIVEKIDTFHPLDDSLLPYMLGVTARRSISTAVTDGLSDDANAATKIKFERCDWNSELFDGRGFGVHVSLVPKREMDLENVWKWEAEQEQWLECFPEVTTAVFGEFNALHCAPYLDGHSGLASLSYSLCQPECEGWAYTTVHWDAALLELVQFRNIETLVLRFGGTMTSDDEFKELDIPAMVEMLPKLRNL